MEEFSLSEHIAYCGALHNGNPFGEPALKSKDSCGWKVPVWGVIFTAKPTCDKVTQEYQGICYNAPSEGNMVFGS